MTHHLLTKQSALSKPDLEWVSQGLDKGFKALLGKYPNTRFPEALDKAWKKRIDLYESLKEPVDIPGMAAYVVGAGRYKSKDANDKYEFRLEIARGFVYAFEKASRTQDPASVYKPFRDRVMECMYHELVHGEQAALEIKDQSARGVTPEEGKRLRELPNRAFDPVHEKEQYFSAPFEITAYGASTWKELENAGFTGSEVEAALRDRSRYLELSRKSPSFNNYLRFETSSPNGVQVFRAFRSALVKAIHAQPAPPVKPKGHKALVDQSKTAVASKYAMKISVPESEHDHFWVEPPAGHEEFWAFRFPPKAQPGDQVIFHMDKKPVAEAVISRIEKPGEHSCEQTGRFKGRWKVYWHPDSFKKIEPKVSSASFPKQRTTPKKASPISYSLDVHNRNFEVYAHAEGDKIVGSIECFWLSPKVGKGVFVECIEVDPAWRRKGIGQELYNRAIEEARKQGAPAFYSDRDGRRQPMAEAAWARIAQRYPVTHDEKLKRQKIDLKAEPASVTAAWPFSRKPEAPTEPKASSLPEYIPPFDQVMTKMGLDVDKDSSAERPAYEKITKGLAALTFPLTVFTVVNNVDLSRASLPPREWGWDEQDVQTYWAAPGRTKMLRGEIKENHNVDWLETVVSMMGSHDLHPDIYILNGLTLPLTGIRMTDQTQWQDPNSFVVPEEQRKQVEQKRAPSMKRVNERSKETTPLAATARLRPPVTRVQAHALLQKKAREVLPERVAR